MKPAGVFHGHCVTLSRSVDAIPAFENFLFYRHGENGYILN